MKFRASRLTSGAAVAAALSLAATPASAEGWGGGHYRDYGDDSGWIVGGIIGIGAIAAITAAASGRTWDDDSYRYYERSEGYPDRDDVYQGWDDQDYGADGQRYYGSDDGGDQSSRSEPDSERTDGNDNIDNIDALVDRCIALVERGDTRVESVDSTDRDSSGWRIAGRVNGNRDFSCAVDSDGRVSEPTIDGTGSDD